MLSDRGSIHQVRKASRTHLDKLTCKARNDFAAEQARNLFFSLATPAPQQHWRQLQYSVYHSTQHGIYTKLIMVLRSAPAPPPELSHPSFFNADPRAKLRFRHPGYPEFDNIILTLHAPDQTVRGGLHHGTASLACAIIARNAWNGYLSRAINGPRLQEPVDAILPPGDYYFHVPDATSAYPVYPSFRDWEFPHRNMPPSWQTRNDVLLEGDLDTIGAASSSGLSTAVTRRDMRCIVSGNGDSLQAAHFCPRTQSEWYNHNAMHVYNLNSRLPPDLTMDDVSNAFTLRADIHKSFDMLAFVIVPKENQWVPHFLTPTHDLGGQFHNMPLQLPNSLSTESILTRFAWAIFPSMLFVRPGQGERNLRIRVNEGDESFYKEEYLGYSGYKPFVPKPSGSRSRSPKKRSAADYETNESTELTAGALPTCQTGKNQVVFPSTKRKRSFSQGSSVVKRLFVGEHKRFDPLQSSLSFTSSIQSTTAPDLIDDRRAELSSRLPSPESYVGFETRAKASSGNTAYPEADIEILRRKHLLAQRPKDPHLYCCNYTEIEADIRAGRSGKKEFDGGYACPECLGFEYEQDFQQVVDDDDDGPKQEHVHSE